jgi:diphthine-ammonia ligase
MALSKQLKVIALISGGKDSIFSILHCIANQHKVVALANLHPPLLGDNGEREDIDSFMYQTVGHSIIPLYADALGIPLFRQEIIGDAVNNEREYTPPIQGNDETEDLTSLLQRIIEEVPEANAISTGAILSTYQRTRVESVAIRLGLTPLSYLWQYLYLSPYRQTSLLDDMRAVGQEAKIIKVASGGLDESFLWQDVAREAVIAKMARRMDMYGAGEGGALIGEGGEFETLTVGGPSPLWKKRIEVESVEKISEGGGSAFARLRGVKLTEKSDAEGSEKCSLRIPPLLDTEFEQVLLHLETLSQTAKGNLGQTRSSNITHCWTSMTATEPEAPATQSPKNGYIHLTNITPPPYGSTADQMTDITYQTLLKLDGLQLDPSNIIHSTILLRDISTFAAINPIYGSMFTKPNPPSRVTVACGELMPPGVDVVLTVVVDANKEQGRRQGLHVQSWSYWAPANIGPYSQAISVPLKSSIVDDGGGNVTKVPRLVHIAGQIPLVPTSMELVTTEQLPQKTYNSLASRDSNEFLAQSILSLQHLWRIGRAMDVQAWTGAVAFISQCSTSEAIRRASIACETWQSIHDILASKDKVNTDERNGESGDVEEYDVWDLKNKVAQLSTSAAEKKDIRPTLPDFTSITFDLNQSSSGSLVFVAQVEELPRSADIEWCSTGIASTSQIRYTSSSHEEYSEQSCLVKISEHSQTEITYTVFEHAGGLNAFMERASDGASRTSTVYTTKPLLQVFLSRFQPMLVPCFGIWGKISDQLKQLEALVVTRKDIDLCVGNP